MSGRVFVSHLVIALFVICYLQNVHGNPFLADFERKFYTEFNKLETHGIRTDEFVGLLTLGDRQESGFGKKCLICRGAVFTVLEYFKSNYTVPKLKDIAVTLCTLFTGSGSVNICTGYVNNFAVNKLVVLLFSFPAQ